ncbi:MAG: VacJ family lipoprotein [Syntrophobacteraceae bacterium]|jgi:phospholipid-binding lipoprotein MlaA
MRSGRRLQVVLTSFLIFTFLCSPLVICTSGFNVVLAASEQTAEPEGAPNGQKVDDPYEHFNRQMFEFNDSLYFHVLKPAAQVYSAVLPAEPRAAINNGFHNLVSPARFVNFLLQVKPDKAGNEALRFVINSTMGIAGMIDIAQFSFGLNNYHSDFGQTLGLWGVGSGPYLFVPVLGPSNPRDLIGFGADSVMDPLFWIPSAWWVSYSVSGMKYLNRYSLRIGEYEEVKKASLDPYIAVRDGYIQYRAHIIEK